MVKRIYMKGSKLEVKHDHQTLLTFWIRSYVLKLLRVGLASIVVIINNFKAMVNSSYTDLS